MTDDIDAIRERNIAACMDLLAKGYTDAQLRLMGCADGCIRAARHRASK